MPEYIAETSDRPDYTFSGHFSPEILTHAKSIRDNRVQKMQEFMEQFTEQSTEQSDQPSETEGE